MREDKREKREEEIRYESRPHCHVGATSAINNHFNTI